MEINGSKMNSSWWCIQNRPVEVRYQTEFSTIFLTREFLFFEVFFYRFTTTDGKSLSLSKSHWIFVSEANQSDVHYVKSSEVTMNHRLIIFNAKVPLRKIEIVEQVGFYAPMTLSGYLTVNNVSTSIFSVRLTFSWRLSSDLDRFVCFYWEKFFDESRRTLLVFFTDSTLLSFRSLAFRAKLQPVRDDRDKRFTSVHRFAQVEHRIHSNRSVGRLLDQKYFHKSNGVDAARIARLINSSMPIRLKSKWPKKDDRFGQFHKELFHLSWICFLSRRFSFIEPNSTIQHELSATVKFALNKNALPLELCREEFLFLLWRSNKTKRKIRLENVGKYSIDGERKRRSFLLLCRVSNWILTEKKRRVSKDFVFSFC